MNRFEKKAPPRIVRIAVTGGPCAGKTSALAEITRHFGGAGWRVLTVAETATELITGGVAPWTCATGDEFQRCLLLLQLEKERTFLQAAASMDCEKVLIVCDRGAMDCKCYMSEGEFDQAAHSCGHTEEELRDMYDAVFHLVTAASGAEEAYTTANNDARRETPEEAARLDARLQEVWQGHRHLRIIGNETDFSEKLRRLLAGIDDYLAGVGEESLS